jgi:hypothetical protein
LLATGGNLTLGYVSALSGLGDDRNYIQITTPVQQGNSGGPLYDGSGHVIGVVVAKLNALRVMLATGDVPQNVNFAVDIGAVRNFLQQNKVQVEETESANELPLPEIAQKARLSTYLIECETQETIVAAPSTLPPPPVSSEPSKPIPVESNKLKFSDVRRPYPSLYPQVFEINISNAGLDRVSQLTIGFVRSTEEKSCSRRLEDYDGFKRFTLDLPPGDSVTLTGEFSAEAKRFCIVRAWGYVVPGYVALAAGPEAGGYVVQVFSGRTEAEAQDQFRALQGKYHGVLGGLQPIIRRADLGEKGVFYRAQIGPFGTIDLANQFCGNLKNAGGQCIVQRN